MWRGNPSHVSNNGPPKATHRLFAERLYRRKPRRTLGHVATARDANPARGLWRRRVSHRDAIVAADGRRTSGATETSRRAARLSARRRTAARHAELVRPDQLSSAQSQ